MVPAVLVSTVSLLPAQDTPEVKKLIKGMPKDVASFVRRTDECNHWGGESPYDKARAKEIKKAVARLRCDQLKADEETLRRKYQDNAKILQVLDKVKDLE